MKDQEYRPQGVSRCILGVLSAYYGACLEKERDDRHTPQTLVGEGTRSGARDKNCHIDRIAFPASRLGYSAGRTANLAHFDNALEETSVFDDPKHFPAGFAAEMEEQAE